MGTVWAFRITRKMRVTWVRFTFNLFGMSKVEISRVYFDWLGF